MVKNVCPRLREIAHTASAEAESRNLGPTFWTIPVHEIYINNQFYPFIPRTSTKREGEDIQKIRYHLVYPPPPPRPEEIWPFQHPHHFNVANYEVGCKWQLICYLNLLLIQMFPSMFLMWTNLSESFNLDLLIAFTTLTMHDAPSAPRPRLGLLLEIPCTVFIKLFLSRWDFSNWARWWNI